MSPNPVTEGDKTRFMMSVAQEIADLRNAAAAQMSRRQRAAMANQADGMEHVLHAVRDWKIRPDGWTPEGS